MFDHPLSGSACQCRVWGAGAFLQHWASRLDRILNMTANVILTDTISIIYYLFNRIIFRLVRLHTTSNLDINVECCSDAERIFRTDLPTIQDLYSTGWGQEKGS